MYKANNEFKFTYRMICGDEFDISLLKDKFPILSKKEMIRTKIPHLSASKGINNFVVCVHKFYIYIGNINENILIEKIEEILSVLPARQENVSSQLIISILPQTDQFGLELSAKTLKYLSKNNINLCLGGVFLC